MAYREPDWGSLTERAAFWGEQRGASSERHRDDVNETLSDMAPMARRFTDLGAPGLLARVWFTALLRDGFALRPSTDIP